MKKSNEDRLVNLSSKTFIQVTALLAALVLAVFGYLISLKPRSRRRA